jgi:protein-S-isoprenylcysteine O-methyltransferase Ste14
VREPLVSAPSPPGLVYAAHGVFWSPMLVRVIADRLHAAPVSPDGPVAAAPQAAPGAKAALWGHMAAFGFLYFGVGHAVFGGGTPSWPLPGLALVLLGAALFAWSLWVFRSWRLLAKLDEGHQLCTDGPFGLVRHPIYTALDLLGIGTALWVPNPFVIIGAVLLVVFSDVRARLEERLLVGAFGAAYSTYMARSRRFVPFVY